MNSSKATISLSLNERPHIAIFIIYLNSLRVNFSLSVKEILYLTLAIHELFKINLPLITKLKTLS